MNSFWHKRIPFRYAVLFLIVVFCFADLGYFFPLSAHQDLPFQVIGECVALLILSLILLLGYSLQKSSTWNAQRGVVRVIGVALVFAVSLLTADWRQSFSGDHFDSAQLFTRLLRALLTGIFTSIFIEIFRPTPLKSSKEEGVVV
ncbi:hypothetical protein ACFPT7_24150 [Acidicapsa dinghuensis]|uniref:Uncharacterized protein n=1 Tax=Acidicapsa dinghuensis TaxID=2218256 RepID=A0ABW1EN34_9BACT|nr:hypothetical protein [Acidicapsa dinghuensis]